MRDALHDRTRSERRRLLATAGATLLAWLPAARAAAPVVTVYKSPLCGCCGGWVEHMRRSGFDVRVRSVPDATPYKEKLGVPTTLASCHTAEVEGYVVEGHVPAGDVRRLLRERPGAKGIAVPGMVPGSPGMDGPPTPYASLLFDAQGRSSVFARH